MIISGFLLFLHKIKRTSQFKASIIAFGLHYLCNVKYISCPIKGQNTTSQ